MYTMKVSYKKLWVMLISKGISRANFRRAVNIAPNTLTKMRRDEEVSMSVLLRICAFLDCNIGDIVDAVRVNCDDLEN